MHGDNGDRMNRSRAYESSLASTLSRALLTQDIPGAVAGTPATLIRRLNGSRNEHSGEGVRIYPDLLDRGPKASLARPNKSILPRSATQIVPPSGSGARLFGGAIAQLRNTDVGAAVTPSANE